LLGAGTAEIFPTSLEQKLVRVGHIQRLVLPEDPTAFVYE
jgi:hypothetical protein